MALTASPGPEVRDAGGLRSRSGRRIILRPGLTSNSSWRLRFVKTTKLNTCDQWWISGNEGAAAPFPFGVLDFSKSIFCATQVRLQVHFRSRLSRTVQLIETITFILS